jgi:serine O-acetyltransferase
MKLMNKLFLFKSIRYCLFLLAKFTKLVKAFFNIIIFPLAYLFYTISTNKSIIEIEINRWIKELFLMNKNTYYNLFYLLTNYPEFRNLFYYRLESYSLLIKWYFPPLKSLHITTPKIGPGLFIQHGFSTIMSASEIGENCWINQQVTIGYSNATDCPVIKNNVTIYAGAKVIGKVVVGNNAKIGANAVVIRDVPDNSTAVGVPARYITNN